MLRISSKQFDAFEKSKSNDVAIQNGVWRFFMTAAQSWKWQRVSASGSILEESDSEYVDYVECLDDAKENGYRYESAQAPIPMAKRHYFEFRR